jgi:wobble nucleotide-excising tRNase
LLLAGEGSNPGKVALHAQYQKDRTKKITERDSKFTEIAKTIGAAIGGSALRDYRKPQAEKEFASLLTKAELSADELGESSLSAKQESLPAIDSITIVRGKLVKDGVAVETRRLLELLEAEARGLLQKTVESEIISRLASNRDISDWVERGFHLHKSHSSNICEYCLQNIPATRVEQLVRHFSDADRKLKQQIDSAVELLEIILSVIQIYGIPDKARFYAELRDDYNRKELEFQILKKEFVSEITLLISELKNKKNRTTDTLELKVSLNVEGFFSSVDELNKIIDTHNKKTSNFEDVKKSAIGKIKQHYLSTIFDEVKQADADILTLNNDVAKLESEIDAIRERIAINMGKVSSDHKACEALNENLATFLGHRELIFIPDITVESGKSGEKHETVNGYKIMRGDKPAEFLSEGEKTAIAFVYFVVHLADNNFKIDQGIIVVDDPVSSFDSSSIYQALGLRVLADTGKERHGEIKQL